MANEVLQYLKHLPAAYRLICEETIARIDEAGLAASEEMRTDPSLFGKFRRLISVIEEQYPYYVFALNRMDIRQGLPPEDQEYDQEGISDQCYAMLSFCHSDRLVNLVRNFDIQLAQSQYPFFTYLHSSINQDRRKLQSEQYRQDQHHGLTNLYEEKKTQKSQQIQRHLKELMEAGSSSLTRADYADIAQLLDVPVDDVSRVLQVHLQTTAVVELDRQIGEEEDAASPYDLIANPNDPMAQQNESQTNRQWQALAQSYHRMQPDKQLLYSYCVTAELIKVELHQLQEKYRRIEGSQRIRTITELFRAAPDLPVQHLLALKNEYIGSGIEIIRPELFDLAIRKQAVPTQQDIAQLLQISPQAVSKAYKKLSAAIDDTSLELS